jgi:hypothetical protein
MNLTLHIPDALAVRLSAGGDIERQVLEALVLEAYRAGQMSKDELGDALGLVALNDLDGFLKAHGVYEEYTLAEFEHEQQALDRLGL